MLWSTNAKTGYVEAMAYSDNNEINGNWKIDSQPLYDHDGGHGMIFKSFSDQYYLVLHYPNKFGKEHPSFMPLKYEDGKFIQQSYTGTENQKTPSLIGIMKG